MEYLNKNGLEYLVKKIKQLIKNNNSPYKVGDIFLTTNKENPADRFGGVWELVSKGKTLVGVDETDEDFETVEKIGGEKTHSLTKEEMAKHSHEVAGSITSKELKGKIRVNAGVTTNGADAGIFNNQSGIASVTTEGDTTATWVQTFVNGGRRNNNINLDASHTHDFDLTASDSGNSQPFNIIQPYFTCYIWKKVSN